MEDNKLYIPYDLRTETEFFPGFGKRQLKHALIGIFGSILFGLLLYAITAEIAAIVITIIIGIAGSIMMTMKSESNLSVVDQITNMTKFKQSQKKYKYVYHDNYIG